MLLCWSLAKQTDLEQTDSNCGFVLCSFHSFLHLFFCLLFAHQIIIHPPSFLPFLIFCSFSCLSHVPCHFSGSHRSPTLIRLQMATSTHKVFPSQLNSALMLILTSFCSIRSLFHLLWDREKNFLGRKEWVKSDIASVKKDVNNMFVQYNQNSFIKISEMRILETILERFRRFCPIFPQFKRF